MYKIIEGIVKELEKENVKIIYNTEIKDFIAENEHLTALVDQNNRRWTADIMVINSDAAVFRGSVFKREKFSKEKLDKKSWTMGPLTLYLGLKCKLPMVHHHNYLSR